MHPRGPFCGGEAQCGFWREVSVGGGVFSLRESRSAQQKGNVVEDESNILQDGTLIDLCGATLLWRSAEGLAKSPVIYNVVRKIYKIILRSSYWLIVFFFIDKTGSRGIS